jgi:hypothetical protein
MLISPAKQDLQNRERRREKRRGVCVWMGGTEVGDMSEGYQVRIGKFQGRVFLCIVSLSL